MQKIPTLFQRDFAGNPQLVTRNLNPEAAWLLESSTAVPTRKRDGTACLIDEAGRLWKRFEARPGRSTPLPQEFIPVYHDAQTGKTFGWRPVSPTDPADQYHREGLRNTEERFTCLSPWTYELVGPMVNGRSKTRNPEGLDCHLLIQHGSEVLTDVPAPDTDNWYDALREWFLVHNVEGIVWWERLIDVTSRRVKIKATDFGVPWPNTCKTEAAA